MRTEKEIRDRLEKTMRDLEEIKKEYNDLCFDVRYEKYMVDLCDTWTFVEAEIKTLRWMLGE